MDLFMYNWLKVMHGGNLVFLFVLAFVALLFRLKVTAVILLLQVICAYMLKTIKLEEWLFDSFIRIGAGLGFLTVFALGLDLFFKVKSKLRSS